MALRVKMGALVTCAIAMATGTGILAAGCGSDEVSADGPGTTSATTGGDTSSAAAGGGNSGAGGAGSSTAATGGSSASGGTTCANGVQDGDETGVDCGGSCDACLTPFNGSCTGAPGAGTDCGPNGGDDCCSKLPVPGGQFDLNNNPNFPASVSPFTLEKYEVTVGRFRAFVDSGLGSQVNPPPAGAGAHPLHPNSGWDPAWNSSLPTNPTALSNSLKCESKYPIWTSTPGANEAYPVCCVSWWEAFAFCAAEGGRLPTEVEWNYAAAGGDEQRPFPWGAQQITPNLALFDCTGDGSPSQQCSFADITNVGSRSTQGDGLFGHSDLSGSLLEWMLDDWAATPPSPCDDCATLTNSATKTARSGNFFLNGTFQKTTNRLFLEPDFDIHCGVGLRCVYDN